MKDRYDAIVVGSGPNGLAAAILMQQQGLEVLLVEGKDTIGGGLRSGELLPGYLYDHCSAVHPMALQSPFFKTLPLAKHGLAYIHPPVLAAHPLIGEKTPVLLSSFSDTAAQFDGADRQAYWNLFADLHRQWPQLIQEVLAPFHFPRHPLAMAGFGVKAIQSAAHVAQRFQGAALKALWAGMAAHAMLPLNYGTTAAVAMVLMLAGHGSGWPIPKGGSQVIADALASYFKSLGGEIATGYAVDSLAQLPSAKALLLDVGPQQLLTLAGHRFSDTYTKQLNRYRYGMGVFKMDWVLREPVPFSAEQARQAGTVHIGNTMEEIAAAEHAVWQGKHQLFTRPVLRRFPYSTSAKGIYICSASTPPGGGVHGMCGYYAAKKALEDVFGMTLK